MIELNNVNIEFPVYNLKARTLKNKMLSFATGGYVSKDSNTIVVKALNNISFKLEEGDKLAIVGHNGAGKSTLLRTLAGIYEPSSGTIDIRGRITSLISISLGINEEATGRENIFIRGALLGLNRKNILNYIDEIIEFSELGDFIDMPLRTYSSGMKMRLAFSIATSVESEIILMDEWLSVGDEDFKIKAEERMQGIVNSSKIVIIATHSKNLVNKICNKALLLEKGKLKQFDEVKVVSELYFKR